MGHLLNPGRLNERILSSPSVPFRPTTVQMPNLALIETKRITVYLCYCDPVLVGWSMHYERCDDVTNEDILSHLHRRGSKWVTCRVQNTNSRHLKLCILS